MFTKILIVIVKWLKETVDKLYYSKYTLGERGALIRTMFPWINQVGEYRKLTDFLSHTSPVDLSLITEAITSFYWGEVSRLTSSNKFNEIERYQGLIDFCQSVKDYSEEAHNLNNQ